MAATAQSPEPFAADRYLEELHGIDLVRTNGKVRQVIGTVIESNGPPMAIGETATIRYRRTAEPVLAEAVGFRDAKVLLMPLGELGGIAAGSEVVALGRPLELGLSQALLGRVLDGLGRPIDGLGPITGAKRAGIGGAPSDALKRRRVTEPLGVGVRAIDGLLTVGKGQRAGIFAGSGVGKSTVLGMIARNTAADVNVIALVGERGKEVRDFLERDLGEAGLKRSVVVVATSDQPALVRIKAAFVATRIAEYFRDQGLDVMLMMDSVTRFAMAQREVGLAIGEPTTTRGYTPSVFALLPKLLERAGTGEHGTITALYTVLVDGDDMNEPVADAVRSILDGHIVLSRRLAAANHYPAIDVLASVSRVMPDVVPPSHATAASTVRDILATYRDAEDLVNIGAYVAGSNPRVDHALARIDQVRLFLRQGIYDRSTFEDAERAIMGLA
ncbi:MAG TPA: flagellar protein export ATPase FliI [Candidatus Limnocylindria bacterium]|jgi:flagellum-specific ATP synthase|nr:flagellar protein export ATPase FliI [Candidatus Limnocylindria bacterium]